MTVYINWLYSQSIGLGVGMEKIVDGTVDAMKLGEIDEMLVKAYVFGENFMDSKFKNVIVSKFVELYEINSECPGPAITNLIYAGTPTGSPLRRLIVDVVVDNAGTNPSLRSIVSGSALVAAHSSFMARLENSDDLHIASKSIRFRCAWICSTW